MNDGRQVFIFWVKVFYFPIIIRILFRMPANDQTELLPVPWT